MQPEVRQGSVVADCPDCGVATTFEHAFAGTTFGRYVASTFAVEGVTYNRAWALLRCAQCHRGGLACLVYRGEPTEPTTSLAQFYPQAVSRLPLPSGVPEGIEAEFREAEVCMGVEAHRAASALFRATLEKVLKANGYTDAGGLKARIETAAEDGVITAARRRRAQDEIRVLGNDVLHDQWRGVTAEEAEMAHHYAQRIIEDFYDERESVVALLVEKGRLSGKAEGGASGTDGNDRGEL